MAPLGRRSITLSENLRKGNQEISLGLKKEKKNIIGKCCTLILSLLVKDMYRGYSRQRNCWRFGSQDFFSCSVFVSSRLWSYLLLDCCCTGEYQAMASKATVKTPSFIEFLSIDSLNDPKISLMWKRSHLKHSTAFRSTRQDLSVMYSLTWKLSKGFALKSVNEHSTWMPNVAPSRLTELVPKGDLHPTRPSALDSPTQP